MNVPPMTEITVILNGEHELIYESDCYAGTVIDCIDVKECDGTNYCDSSENSVCHNAVGKL